MAFQTISTKEHPPQTQGQPEPATPEWHRRLNTRQRLAIGAAVVPAAVGLIFIGTLFDGNETTATTTVAPTTTETPTTMVEVTSTFPNTTLSPAEVHYTEALEAIYQGELPMLTRDYIETQLDGDYTRAFNLWLESFEQFFNEDSAIGTTIPSASERMAKLAQLVHPDSIDSVSDNYYNIARDLAAWRSNTNQEYSLANPMQYRVEFYSEPGFRLADITTDGALFYGTVVNSGGSVVGWRVEGPWVFFDGAIEMRFGGPNEILTIYSAASGQ